MNRPYYLRPQLTYLTLAALMSASNAFALDVDPLVEFLHQPQAEHADQQTLRNLVANGQAHAAFEEAFELGDELFEATFNAIDGVGANVGQNQRFTRVPRADLKSAGEWADHFPQRATGPNAQACNSCHNLPADDGAGQTSSNVHRDPLHKGKMSSFIIRNTPHVFGLGGLQRLAEEMTDELHAQLDDATAEICNTSKPNQENKVLSLTAKGVEFGSLTVKGTNSNPCTVKLDTSALEGIDADLIVRPFQWKGSELSIRGFNRDAAHNELGMQPVETTGDGLDGDFDGVADEMTVGDMTALVIYLAAQPRPTSKLELSGLGLMTLSNAERQSINAGSQTFEQVGCASCHTPAMTANDPIFSEPSQNPLYRDDVFPAGQDPIARGVDPAFAVTFDLTSDHPDNIIDFNGQEVRLGSFESDNRGGAIIGLYSDLKRHDMGSALAETIDEAGTGAATWMTKELWGVGSTEPYLHDGRATTLTEAILAHGGEADAARQAFEGLQSSKQDDVIAFLENLILFKL